MTGLQCGRSEFGAVAGEDLADHPRTGTLRAA